MLMGFSQFEIFKVENGQTEVLVKLEGETVWLSLNQMADLFQRDKSVISRHLRNVFAEGELGRDQTVANFATVQTEGGKEVERSIEFYNLDVIISIGYRVKSNRGTQFRIWANEILKEHLIKGYSINERVLTQQNEQLKSLQETIKILGGVLNARHLSNEESTGLLGIIADYAYGLKVLDQYDYQELEIEATSGTETYRLTYQEALNQISLVKDVYGNSELFGREKDDSFQSSVNSIYQTFNARDLYPSIEEKAANLLYFVTKNHSFSDGNKRIAAFLFLYFLDKNGALYSESGLKRIADNALVALTLMIAGSKPEEKDTMVKVIVNLINKRN